jgi:AP-1 complex subunit beta-1
LIALGECTEWGRIAILGAVARYKAEDEKEAEHICERVIPQFQHANGSVVLAAIKVRPPQTKLLYFCELTRSLQVVMIHIEAIGDADFVKNILRKMAPPLGAFIAAPSCSPSIGRC